MVDYYIHISDACILTQQEGSFVIPNDQGMIDKWNTRLPIENLVLQIQKDTDKWCDVYIDAKKRGSVNEYADGYSGALENTLSGIKECVRDGFISGN